MTSGRSASAPAPARGGTGEDAPRRRRRRHDVVFYTPWIGSILSRRESLPPGGAETQILMLARGLARRGANVAIVVFGTESELPRQLDGITIISRSMPTGPRFLGLAEIARIWRALAAADAAVIVRRGMGLDVGVLAVYGALRRRPLILSIANVVDFDARRLLRRRDRVLYEYGARHADTIVVQTEEQVELCWRKFNRRSRLIRSLAPPAAGPTGHPEAFLWVGRLVSYKRPLDYIALARAVPEATFWMVGVPVNDTAQQGLADQVTSEVARTPNLELLASRPHAEVGDLMDRAVASVNTSEFEGMPNVLLEAWSRGVPALVLRHDPDGVVSRHGLGGFADGSPSRLADLARDQWVNRHDREELAERCRRYVADHHSPEKVIDGWVDVLSAHQPFLRMSPAGSGESRCAA